MPKNTVLQAQELAKFAVEQNFDERYLEYFADVWLEAGVKDISRMTTQDAERTMQVLSSSEASFEFVKAFLAQAVRQGMPFQVLEYILLSDTDGDGRTLAQEIFQDATDPFEPDAPDVAPAIEYVTNSRNQGFDLEL
ncbi:hypothetical protein [Dendronalium sp. ChiSLP03b]|uniref:hypothetical protein n=1 Tax=Dendronalium sp. ChiSLP03b TaxID=3075381 RepID=UPI002AD2AFFB|nr:hypothetical protein [Dendronalium sp. ChiSLP03b]MDZ8203507.1 hypothetical protein [Dendronalium sp. ChiSLP03b]